MQCSSVTEAERTSVSSVDASGPIPVIFKVITCKLNNIDKPLGLKLLFL